MILAAVVFGLCSRSAHGQDEVFRFTPFDIKYHQRVYAIADGMPQSTATSIIQARDGYIWMTTFGGLARYDGLTFKLFTTSNEPGLANNRLTKIYEAPDGVIWIGSEDGDIVKYENGTFRTVYQSPGAPFEKTVTSIVADNSGRLWVGSINGLKWIDIATEQVTPFTEDAAFLSTGRRLSSDISELSVHRDLLYIGTTSGLYRTDLRTPGKLEYIEELDGQNILDFSAIGKDTLLILTGRELVHMDTTSDRLIRRDLSEGSIGHLSSPTDSGTIMIKNGYLYRVTESNIEPPMAGSRFRGNITSVLADNEGNVWIGSDIGLIKLQRRNIWDFSRVRNGVPSSASSIIEGVDGTIFFVSGHRLLKWDNNTVSRIHVANEHLASWRQVIRSLGKDPEGNLFLSGIDNMWKLDQRTLTSTEVFEPAPFDKEVGVIFFDSKGTRWLGSKEAGVQILRANVRTLLNTSNGLAGNSVVRIRESSDGTVWVATRTGLSRIKDGEITNFTTEQGLEQ